MVTEDLLSISVTSIPTYDYPFSSKVIALLSIKVNLFLLDSEARNNDISNNIKTM